MTYATGTTVSETQSRAQIVALLERVGAVGITCGANAKGNGVVCFTAKGRTVRMLVPMPDWEGERRRRWRAVLLVLKAKFEAAASGISTFDDEFLAHIALGNGMTVRQHVAPMLQIGGRA